MAVTLINGFFEVVAFLIFASPFIYLFALLAVSVYEICQEVRADKREVL